MSQVCELSGKRPQVGHNVSHSERKTKRRFLPNISTRTIIDPISGKKLKLKISTRAMRTILKNPLKYKQELKKLIAKKQS